MYCSFQKCGILGFYAGKSHNLIGQGIFHGDQKVEISMKNPESYQIMRFSSIKS
jgi:hypothetical protein